MIYLASASPQRSQILRELDLTFTVLPVEVEEVALVTPEATVCENARRKAERALPQCPTDAVALGADTVVEIDGKILGKPGSTEEARRFLSLLSGRVVKAWSGISLCRLRDGKTVSQTACESASAKIKALTDGEIDWYVATGEPMTRAGAFGISRIGEIFVERIEGSYSCFAGLPKRLLLSML
ncbi:MAG: septum formation protein Maf [Kiritimatiellae bacterium]|nr:septum formation protein Maf [Kiritimatiellia bacterium]